MPRTRLQARALNLNRAQAEAEAEDSDGDDSSFLDLDSFDAYDIHDNESSVITSFLRNLLRRQVYRYRNQYSAYATGMDSDDSDYSIISFNGNNSRSDDDSDEYELINGSLHSSGEEDTSRIDSSYLKQSLTFNSACSSVTAGKRGLNSGPFKSTKVSLPSLIAQREIHGRKAANFGRISCHFLPNTGTTLSQHGTKGFCVKFDKEARVLLHAAQDNKVRIYDCSSSKFDLARTVNAQDVGWSIVDLDISNDGSVLAYSSWSDSIRTCVIPYDSKGTVVKSPSATVSNNCHDTLPLNPMVNSFCVFSLCFSSDASEIIAGANDGCIYVYDRHKHERTLRISAHDEDINSVKFAASTNLIVSGSDDGIVKIWDRRALNESAPKPVGIFTGHIAGITSIDTREDGRHIISNSKDQTIKLWDMRKFSSSESLADAKSKVDSNNWDYRWMPTPRPIVLNRTVLDWDTSLMTYRGHTVRQTLIRSYFSPSFSTGQRYIYTGCSTGQVVVSKNILTLFCLFFVRFKC